MSGTIDLTTIPRASSITATDANIGSASTININSADSSFKHTIEYNFSGLTGTIVTKTSQTSIGWSIPTSFYEKIPESFSGTVTLTCYTYSGDTHIGTKTTTMTVSVPTTGNNNSSPVIDTATAIDVNEKTIALTNDNSRLVTGVSNVKLDVTGRCLNYANFDSLKEQNTNFTTETTSSKGTTNVTGSLLINQNTLNIFKIFMYDKRGLWATKALKEETGDFKIVPYIPLTISVDAERLSPTSNSIKLNFSGNFYNGYYDEAKSNFNDLIIRWRYKLRDSGSWITEGADDAENGWHNLALGIDFKYNENENKYSSIEDIEIEDLFDYQEDYIIEILYQDRLTSYTNSQPILAGIPNHDYGKDVNGNNYFNENGEYYKNNRLLIGEYKKLDSPLTNINLTYKAEELLNAKYVIIFYTLQGTGLNYLNAVIVVPRK